MRHSELQTSLLEKLHALLRSEGYHLRDQGLDVERGEVRWTLHIAFVRHAADLAVIADVAVRHHAVEERLAAQRTDLKRREQRRTATVGVELGNWADGHQHRWNITSVEEVGPTAQSIVQRFQAVGLPFLERFSSLQETLRVLEGGDQEGRLICPIVTTRVAVIKAARAILAHRAA